MAGGIRRCFLELIRESQVEEALNINLFAAPTALLCSEATPKRGHRRLVLEYLDQEWGSVRAVHL